jgi:5-methylcytosine-specific restriction endonuclease McrA
MANIDGSTLKSCTLCKQEKPVQDFTKDKNRVDGFYVWCRSCKKKKASEYYAKNPESVKKRVDIWRKKNWEQLKPKFLEYRHRRMAREKNAQGTHTKNDVYVLLELQNHKCAECKTSLGKEFHLDHIMPLFLGGSNDRSNLQMLCPTCNLKKSFKDPIKWANENGRLL